MQCACCLDKCYADTVKAILMSFVSHAFIFPFFLVLIQEKCGVFRINVGIILNCCRSPEGLAIVRTMNIKNNFIPFLSKDTPGKLSKEIPDASFKI